jgi:hypothetical protein
MGNLYVHKVSNVFKYTNFESAHKAGNSIKSQVMTHYQRNPYSNSRVYIINYILPRS